MITFRRLTVSLLFLSGFFCDKAFTQTTNIASQENTFVSLYSKLASFNQLDYDSVTLYSDKFETGFIKFIQSNPETLNYPFKKLVGSNFCEVRTSCDGDFRIYSWDTQTGGTMHTFETIYQWKNNGKVFTKIPKYHEGDAGSFCSNIFTVNGSYRTFYLTLTTRIFSTKDARQSISAYSIEGSKLDDTVKLFKTKTKKLNSIDVDFDFSSVVDRPERPLELITYDDKQKIIHIPVVGGKGQVTEKSILYKLQGDYFEFMGIQTGVGK